MSEPMLIAADLTKAYTLMRGRLEVLRGVGLRLGRGEFCALRGASGAGKSTLLHLLGGLDTPDTGRISVEGAELTRMGAGELVRFRNRRVGFVFQGFHLLPEFDALENVALPARIARTPLKDALAKAEELLRRVGLGARLNHRPAELSGGEQQRVAIARSLVNDPPLLLADEPTGNLDSRTGEEVLGLLTELQAERGLALVIATHDDRVAARAGRVVELIDGRVQNNPTPGM
jgi:predicted ABC-type transport system involved in lysophospholipase L1 biosynthesis ATPase subunit